MLEGSGKKAVKRLITASHGSIDLVLVHRSKVKGNKNTVTKGYRLCGLN